MSMEATGMDTTWKGLYKFGGAALLIDGVLFFVAIALFAVGGNPPTDTTQYLKTYATSNVNLLSSGIFSVIAILFVPAILGLYGALKQVNKPWMLIATGLVFLAIGVFFVEEIGTFASISLGQSYASASNAAQQTSYVAAAQAMIAFTSAAGFIGVTIVSLGYLLIGLTMLKGMFGKGLAYFSILVGLLGLAEGIPGLGALFIVFVIVYAVWFLWAGFKLYRMG